jgi:hypothetical protein
VSATQGLTCNAVMKKAKLSTSECCEKCHSLYERDYTKHRLHFIPWKFVDDENRTIELYVCCNVEQALTYKAAQAAKGINFKLSGGGGGGIATAFNTVTNGGNFYTLKDAADEMLTKVEESIKAEQEQVEKIGAALLQGKPGFWTEHPKVGKGQVTWNNYCAKAACPSCMTDAGRYWSYKLQQWVPTLVYDEANVLYKLDLHHPGLHHAEMHQCSPHAYKSVDQDKIVLPEPHAWMCRLPDGSPTFGIKYCANPFFVAACVEPQGGNGTHLVVGIPDGDKVSDWIPLKFAHHVSNVIYLDPPF